MNKEYAMGRLRESLVYATEGEAEEIEGKGQGEEDTER
jgi:hypothetical protein